MLLGPHRWLLVVVDGGPGHRIDGPQMLFGREDGALGCADVGVRGGAEFGGLGRVSRVSAQGEAGGDDDGDGAGDGGDGEGSGDAGGEGPVQG